MHWLVCFDISDNKARREVVKLLLSSGVRVQYSMYEIQLKPPEFTALTAAVDEWLDDETDRVHYVPLNPTDRANRRAFGIAPLVTFQDFWVL
ncbi:CRISPR-associated endonuclease Cas2 [Alkalimonas sp. MEB108]|uniref:CRISPR-associated endoribonuclease Cas2 n=1 Tax=Alkalimonas cellulosilytica TaxID=3058395 RepID=A0ABU7J9S6_9GAMM|nr:CRISPR-associated endonuclease Cas2 [Alkalimonas sp. MEB108]MEE2003018.1 CRISPR-associated endonuclease Cas2 [Alkalimonas sp. MEB108]